MRIALQIEYDGSRYHGWQSQPGLHTIQNALEIALSRVADEPISVICAGRTDTGVHATHQIVHFDCSKNRNIRAWIQGTNAFLPKDICVRWGKEVSEEFHARFAAILRYYRYFIYNSAIRPALLHGNIVWQHRPLDHNLMHEAGQYILGEQDFTSFRSIECQSKTPMRKVHHVQVTRKRDFIMIEISANAFLHNMVRNIVGVLTSVGSGRHPAKWVADVLQAKDRKLGAETASPYGLYLINVIYPDNFGIISGEDNLPFCL